MNGGLVNTRRRERKGDMIWSQDNEFNFKVKKTCYEKNRERKKKEKKKIVQQSYSSQMLFGESIDF